VTTAELEAKHIAELHARAAELGVPGFRKLRREELIAELEAQGGKEAVDTEAEADEQQAEADEPQAEERPTRRRRRSQAAEPREEPADEGKREEEPAGEPVSGVLDVLAAGHGFLRLEGLEPGADDVYISASQIRRCELRSGDSVEGPARQPRRGERHPALVRVEKVNGEEPGEGRSSGFDDLTPVKPHRRLSLADSDDLELRAIDLLAPLAYGQRVLVIADPHSGRTTLLRGLVRAIAAQSDPPGVIVLLVDERPEEVTEWKRLAEGIEIAAAPADLEAADQVRHAELAVARARRRAENGEDVIVLVDSLTRLGVVHRDPIAVKPVFGAGRELEEEGSGSLTVIATVLRGTEDGEGALEAVETTENATIVLDAGLAAAGVSPPIDVQRTGTVDEERLREPEELEAVRRLRAELREDDLRGAAESLAEKLRSSASNAELLSSL
jgi:transcription termination factor Rho